MNPPIRPVASSPSASRRLPVAGGAGTRQPCVAPVPRPAVACPAYGKLQPAVPAALPTRPSRRDELLAAYRQLHPAPPTAPQGVPRRRPRRLLRAPLAVATALLCHASAAVPPPPVLEYPRSQAFLYELELGTYLSDNRSRRSPSDDAGVVLLPGMNFSWFRLGSRFEARATGRIEHYQWLESGPEDDLRLRLAAALDWQIVPQRLYWTLQDYADTQPVNLLLGDSPDNLQQTNVVLTGPSLRLWPQGIWSGLVEARYAHSYAEVTEAFNSERLSASAWLRYQPHPRRLFSIGAEGSDVEFREQSPDNPDFRRTDYVARYQSHFRRLGFELAGGRSRIEYVTGEEVTGPIARATVRFDFNENHQLRVSALREYSDAVRDMLGEVNRFDRPREMRSRPQLRPQQFRVESAEVAWRSRHPRGEWWVMPYARDYDYPFEDEPLTHQATGITAEGRYRLNSTLDLRGEIAFERRRFEDDLRVDRDARVGLHLERMLNSRWSLRTGVIRYDRRSNGDGANYRENVLAVALVRHGGL